MKQKKARIDLIDGVMVVRDDLFPGGTKARALSEFLRKGNEFVYCSPAYGYAQVALGYACRKLKKRAVIFVAKRKELHPLTLEAKRAGAIIREVPTGYMTVLRKRARAYCSLTGAQLLPFGLKSPEFQKLFIRCLRDSIDGVPLPSGPPRHVWCVSGSGSLASALFEVFPESDIHAVRIGSAPQLPDSKRMHLYQAEERFQQPAKEPPPFPSCANYDAKAWRILRQKKSGPASTLFWNVAG